ncbi:MAG: type II toxin-antitoxin system VapC family toxin [Candidatus Eremiobacter antarcticus]
MKSADRDLTVESEERSRVLLDTHIFLWAAGAPERLSPAARDAIQDPKNEVFVSAAVVWEVVIKHAAGKLRLPSSPITYVPSAIAQLGFYHLPITHEHVLAIASLPNHHPDPFDRVMIAQARFEGMTLISADRRVARYAVQYLPAVS